MHIFTELRIALIFCSFPANFRYVIRHLLCVVYKADLAADNIPSLSS